MRIKIYAACASHFYGCLPWCWVPIVAQRASILRVARRTRPTGIQTHSLGCARVKGHTRNTQRERRDTFLVRGRRRMQILFSPQRQHLLAKMQVCTFEFTLFKSGRALDFSRWLYDPSEKLSDSFRIFTFCSSLSFHLQLGQISFVCFKFLKKSWILKWIQLKRKLVFFNDWNHYGTLFVSRFKIKYRNKQSFNSATIWFERCPSVLIFRIEKD